MNKHPRTASSDQEGSADPDDGSPPVAKNSPSLSEDAAKERRRGFEIAIEASNSGLWVWNVITNTASFSPKWKEILGYEDHEIKGQFSEFSSRLHPKDRDRVNQEIAAHLEARALPLEIEFRLRHKDGFYRWILARGTAIRDASGKVTCLAGSNIDITERKQTEQELRENEEKFQAIFEGNNDALMLLTERGYFDCNRQALKVFGFKRKKDFLKTTPAELSPLLQPNGQSSATQAQVRMRAAFQQGALCFEWMHMRQDGSEFLAEVQLSAFELNGEKVLQAAVRDITDRRSAEQSLRLTKFALEHTSDAVLWINSNAQLLNVNWAACRLLGYTREELLSMTVDQFNPEFPKENLEAAWEQLALKRSLTFETHLKTKDGRWVPVEVNLNYIDFEGTGVNVSFIRDISSRKQAEQAAVRNRDRLEELVKERTREVEESQEHIRAVVETVADGILTFDQQGTVHSFNPAGARLFGYTAEEVMGQNLEMLMPALGRGQREASEVDWLLFTGQELVGRRKNGGELLLDFSVTHFIIGEQRFFTGVARDITERKRVERILLQSEKRAQLLKDVAASANAASTIEEALRMAVEAMARYAGWPIGHIYLVESSTNLADSYLWFLQNAECYESFQKATREIQVKIGEGLPGRVLAGAKPCWIDDVSQDSNFPRRTAALACQLRGAFGFPVLVAGKVTAILEFFSNKIEHPDQGLLDLAMEIGVQLGIVIERKRIEEQIRTLSRAVEQSPVSVVITDKDGSIKYVNPKFCEVTGYSEQEAMGQNPRILKSAEHSPEFYQQMWRTLSSGRAWFGEFLNRKRDGSEYWERASISPVRDARGVTTHYVAVKEDITEQKRILAELQQAKEAAEANNRAKSAFLANMSHEIRTPMNAILGFSQLMLRDPGLTERQKQHLDTVNRSGEHLLSLINDILEMSKIEAGHIRLSPALFDLHSMLDNLRLMFRVRTDAKKLSLVIECASDTPRFVISDEKKLRQVLINVLGNSVKFTGQGGIHMRVKAKRLSAGHLRLCIEVEDTGVGIAAAEMSKLFQHFEQTQSGRSSGAGTGLGLAISREFIRLMGGEISASSEVGKGTTFWIEIPVQEGAADPGGKQTDHGTVLGLASGTPLLRVLIADDHEENRTLLSELLNSVGFETRHARNGLEAVQEFEAWSPQLVLMDVRMPVMDGIEAIRRIRASSAGQPRIVTVTASAFHENRAEALRTGADDFMAKPFREYELFEKIKSLLGIEYVYKRPLAAAPLSVFDEVEIGKALAGLPQLLVQQLCEATVNADLDRVLKLTDEVAKLDVRLGEELRSLAESFDYSRLLLLLQKKKAN